MGTPLKALMFEGIQDILFSTKKLFHERQQQQQERFFHVAVGDHVWTSITPTEDYDFTCSKAGCDGKFVMEDGVTLYDYAAMGNLYLNHK